ncbi:DUF4189 domain-containing protein [Frateuria defendens]|uniref:DUF4189 domain-containing protein n=1 Tax=Frateuria defendens TaxID=2219559 RepID=UPI0013792234
MPGYGGRANNRQIWADRWGAIAYDSKTGDMGTAEGQVSKEKAREIALALCGSTGASQCKVMLAFYNQCAAAVWGMGRLNVSGAPTQEEAEQDAMNRCGGGSSCQIFYSKCSYAERVR